MVKILCSTLEVLSDNFGAIVYCFKRKLCMVLLVYLHVIMFHFKNYYNDIY